MHRSRKRKKLEKQYEEALERTLQEAAETKKDRRTPSQKAFDRAQEKRV